YGRISRVLKVRGRQQPEHLRQVFVPPRSQAFMKNTLCVPGEFRVRGFCCLFRCELQRKEPATQVNDDDEENQREDSARPADHLPPQRRQNCRRSDAPATDRCPQADSFQQSLSGETRADLRNVLRRWRRGELAQQQVNDWATRDLVLMSGTLRTTREGSRGSFGHPRYEPHDGRGRPNIFWRC